MSFSTSNDGGTSPGSPGGRSPSSEATSERTAPFELFESMEGFVACPEVSCIQLEHWSKAELVDVDDEISSATLPFVDTRGERMRWREYASTCNIPSLQELFESRDSLVACPEVSCSQLEHWSKAELVDVDDEISSATIPFVDARERRMRWREYASTCNIPSLAELSARGERIRRRRFPSTSNVPSLPELSVRGERMRWRKFPATRNVPSLAELSARGERMRWREFPATSNVPSLAELNMQDGAELP
jgi:hypothetical protein